MQQKKYCVYMHINKINDKKYIGLTCQKPQDRWRKGKGYKRCLVFYRAIQKYGWDSFQHIIIEDNLSIQQADTMQKNLIAKYRTMQKQFGYNIKSGGSNPPLTEQIKKKISVSHLGQLNPMYNRKHTEEQKQNLRKKLSGQNNPHYGKHCDKQTKLKIANKVFGQRKWRCVQLDIVFDLLQDAARFVGGCHTSISNCAYGKQKTAYGYHWELVC